ncbi:MAG: efflux RND transporter permease subunit [Balneolaceae bacterium]|nr:efflux RND transporter permease subunit [Balneolaceae bacterium]MBO6547781.1 efflux RND transporter permease subunit [Balneolaceae bacterium]MBO6648292.1 efflux RND transporter permease subunit [Balneolaceae bacterium]
MSLTELSVKRPVTTMMVFVSLVVVGTIATRLVPLEFFPTLSFPGAFIQVPYPNASPEEVEEELIKPMEEVLATISGVERMNSNAGEDNGGIQIIFKQGSDINLKAIEIKEKIESVRNQFPDDFEYYNIFKFQADGGNALQLRISSDRDLSDSFDLLNRNLKQRIERIDGVGQVTLYGVEKKEIRIELLTDRILSYNIDLNQLTATLSRANFSTSAGKITDSGLRYNVRPMGELRGVEDIENLIIGENNLRVKDIAEVKYTEPVRNYARHLDMKYAIGLDIVKESSANTVETVSRVLEEIEEINKLPEMQGITIYEMQNQADGILSSLRELLSAGILGAFLSIFMLYFFLRQFSTTLVVATAVPFSLIVTLGFFFFLDISLNILSMMGLMLAVGMLVDNAVVVTENIHRHQRKGTKPSKAAIFGAKEVGIAVTAGTLTSVVVFLPNIVNESFIKQHMYYVGMPIIISLIASLFISLTVIPLLSSKIKPPKQRKTTIIDKFADKYARFLGWFVDRRWVSSISIILLFLSGIIPFASGLLNVDMFPQTESREIQLRYNLNDSYTLDRVKQTVDKVEKYLYENKEQFEIESVYTYYQPEFANSTIILTNEDVAIKSVPLIKKEIEENLPVVTIGEPAFEFRSRSSNEGIRVFVQGESMDVLEELAEQVEWRMNQIEGLADVKSEAEIGKSEVQLTIDHERARNFGLTSSSVAQAVSASVRGRNLRKIRGPESEIDVILALKNSDRQSIDDLKELPISIGDNKSIKLASVANFEESNGPGRIFRENRKTSLGININLDDITMDEARPKISEVMDQIVYPAGYRWSYGRSFSQDTEAMNQMIFNILIAFFLIYLVMAALFESLMYPTSILACIFYGIIGIFWFFTITGTTFDLMAMIGILILMGIVVNNGIVLIDHILHLRSEGMSRREAVVQGGKDRMRPILMTAGTTVLGLIPLCIGNTQIGGDGPPYFPMARAIVGGLTFSTVVTLVVLPSIYIILDDIRLWAGRIGVMSRVR